MRIVCFAFISLTLLSACEQLPSVPKSQPQNPAAVAKPIEPSIPIEPSKPLPAPIAPSHPAASSKGVNRFGILPAVCGADKAASYIGRVADAQVRQAVTRLVGHENIRWTPPGQAEIENFLPERLNMLLDKSGRIKSVDCY